MLSGSVVFFSICPKDEFFVLEWVRVRQTSTNTTSLLMVQVFSAHCCQFRIHREVRGEQSELSSLCRQQRCPNVSMSTKCVHVSIYDTEIDKQMETNYRGLRRPCFLYQWANDIFLLHKQSFRLRSAGSLCINSVCCLCVQEAKKSPQKLEQHSSWNLCWCLWTEGELNSIGKETQQKDFCTVLACIISPARNQNECVYVFLQLEVDSWCLLTWWAALRGRHQWLRSPSQAVTA